MLPNSEKFYAWVIVFVASIFFIAAAVTTYNVVTNQEVEETPRYQKLPPKAVALPPEPYIIDKANVQVPIKDDDYQLFHRTTREVTPMFTDNKWEKELSSLVVSPAVSSNIKDQQDKFEQSLENTKISKAQGVSVDRPENKTCEFALQWCKDYCTYNSQTDNQLERDDLTNYKCLTLGSSANVEYTYTSADLDVIDTNSLLAQYIWLQNINDGSWKLAEVQLIFNGQDQSEEEAPTKEENLSSEQLNELEEIDPNSQTTPEEEVIP